MNNYFWGFGVLCLLWTIVFIVCHLVEDSFSIKFIVMWAFYSIVLIGLGFVFR
jgi:hypothetical protein